MNIYMSLENEIRFNVRNIAENGGYSYLNCFEGQWKDGYGHVHKLEDMSKTYLSNCLREVKNAQKCINILFESVINSIDLENAEFTKEEKEEILNLAKAAIREALKNKQKEIEEVI